MWRSGATYCPSPLVGRLRVIPVSLLVMTMAALGTAAPVGSVTVPTMVASCAHADVANSDRKKHAMKQIVARRLTLRPLTTRPKLPAYVGERDFICQPPEFPIVGVSCANCPLNVNVHGLHPVCSRCQEENRFSSQFDPCFAAGADLRPKSGCFWPEFWPWGGRLTKS